MTYCGIVSRPTADGHWIARDIATNETASGRTQDEAEANLRRLLAARRAA